MHPNSRSVRLLTRHSNFDRRRSLKCQASSERAFERPILRTNSLCKLYLASGAARSFGRNFELALRPRRGPRFYSRTHVAAHHYLSTERRGRGPAQHYRRGRSTGRLRPSRGFGPAVPRHRDNALRPLWSGRQVVTTSKLHRKQRSNIGVTFEFPQNLQTADNQQPLTTDRPAARTTRLYEHRVPRPNHRCRHRHRKPDRPGLGVRRTHPIRQHACTGQPKRRSSRGSVTDRQAGWRQPPCGRA